MLWAVRGLYILPTSVMMTVRLLNARPLCSTGTLHRSYAGAALCSNFSGQDLRAIRSTSRAIETSHQRTRHEYINALRARRPYRMELLLWSCTCDEATLDIGRAPCGRCRAMTGLQQRAFRAEYNQAPGAYAPMTLCAVFHSSVSNGIMYGCHEGGPAV
ncbi:hypothetical protein OH77DRAFT_688527 [Trametes cingulata]|nr:hypothetical protein OH77DRAFT_688527 [Trametes cingulata]